MVRKSLACGTHLGPDFHRAVHEVNHGVGLVEADVGEDLLVVQHEGDLDHAARKLHSPAWPTLPLTLPTLRVHNTLDTSLDCSTRRSPQDLVEAAVLRDDLSCSVGLNGVVDRRASDLELDLAGIALGAPRIGVGLHEMIEYNVVSSGEPDRMCVQLSMPILIRCYRSFFVSFVSADRFRSRFPVNLQFVPSLIGFP